MKTTTNSQDLLHHHPVLIPKQKLIEHWKRYAHQVIEWLTGRPVTLEAVYNNKVVYRRYTDRNHTKLITISSPEEVVMWASRHVYSFHPYICHHGQIAPCWYVLDIDPDIQVDFKLTTKITRHIVIRLRNLYPERRIDLAFCGKNGYHIFMWLGKMDQTKLFDFSKELTLELARYIATHSDILKFINITFTSKDEQNNFRQFLQTKRIETITQPTIKLDTRILHRFANIRSPYSIHPYTGKMSRLVTNG